MVPWSQLRQPFSGWVLTVLNSEFTHFNLVIHLSKSQQLALPFCTFFVKSRGSCRPLRSLWNSFLLSEVVPNIQKPLILQHFHSDIWQHYMKLDQAGSCLSGVVFFLLMVVWWGETCCAPNSLELESCFMPIGARLDHGPGEGNNRTNSRSRNWVLRILLFY